MSAPVSYTESSFSGGTLVNNKAVTVDVQQGDLLVVNAVTEDFATAKVADVSTGAETWTLQQSVTISGNSGAYAFTAVAESTATLTVTTTLVNASSKAWGFGVSVYRSHGGVGVSDSATGSGVPELDLDVSEGSSVAAAIGDWNAIDGASRGWLSGFEEASYFRDPVAYSVYVGVADGLTAGTKQVGLSAPAGQKFSIVAVEVKAPAAVPAPVADAGADQTGIEPGATVTLHGSATNSPTSYVWTQQSGVSVALSDATAAEPTFTAPTSSSRLVLAFSLVATNAGGSSGPDTVLVTVLPQLEWLLLSDGWVPKVDTLF